MSSLKESSKTFAAIATAMSPGSIGIVRISGPESFDVIRRIFRPAHPARFSKMETHTIHYGHILSETGAVIDEVMVLLMRGPKSFTAEDTVEIDTHGGILVTRQVLERVLSAGARVAEPGEFTKQAFLNGRVDLSEAEAVMDLINSKNAFAASAALSQLQGSVRNEIKSMRDTLLDAVAFIEAALDDPEHISLDGYTKKLQEKLEPMERKIRKMIADYQDGAVLKEGVKTVLLGKPNAGKSSLLNALLGQERAIVTDIAGTTRDTLSEQVYIGGIGFEFTDTAGIRETQDVVETIGVERSITQAQDADLLLFVADASLPLDENDRRILEILKEKKSLVLYNKTDLEPKLTIDELSKYCAPETILPVSAKTGEGLEAIKERLVSMFRAGELLYNDEVLITNVRHKEALETALESLKQALEGILGDVSEDFLTIDLLDAYEALGRITGETLEEDVADRIFEKFCMGK